MDNNYRQANVYIRDIFAGVIEEVDEGYRFTYSSEYLNSNNIPVSLTMPLTSKPYISSILFPFFDGLIPEGWLLNIASHNWKIDAKDRFGLLLVTCKDCIGAVNVKEEAKQQ